MTVQPYLLNRSSLSHTHIMKRHVSDKDEESPEATLPTAAPAEKKPHAPPVHHLSHINAHVRDRFITFREEGHEYTIEGLEGHPVSVTTVIHTMFQEFDADVVIDKMMASRKWPFSKYHGMTKQQIKDLWETNREEASKAGTAMHKAIEDFINLPEEERVAVLTHFKSSSNNNGSVPPPHPQTPEFRMFLCFWDEFINKLHYKPYRTEWLVYDKDKHLSGSIDFVAEQPDGDGVAILDWKRSKEIRRFNPFAKGKGCMSHLPDSNFWHYSLQLNIYRHLLETHYGKRVKEMCLVVMHPNNEEYELHVVQRMTTEIDGLMGLLPLPQSVVDALAQKKHTTGDAEHE